MTKLYGWIAAVALVVAAVFVLVKKHQKNTRLAENLAIAEAQETVAVAFARQQTANLEVERQKTIQVERELYKERLNSLNSIHSADSIAADAHQVLRDSASSNATLRASLGVTVASLDEVSGQFRAYIARTDSVLYRVAVEREATDSALAAERNVSMAKDNVIAALRKQGQCKVWFVSCPTRTQSFVLGAIATGAVVIALR